MLAAALGQEFEVAAAQRPVDRASVEVTIDGDRLPMGVTRQIVATFRVQAGFPVLGDMGPGVGRVPAMNGARHFQKLIDRRAGAGSASDNQ